MTTMRARCAVGVCLLMATALASAQQPSGEGLAQVAASGVEEQLALHRVAEGGPLTYGTDDPVVYQIPAAAFVPINDSANYLIETDGYIRLPGSTREAIAPVNLPNGVQIAWFDMWYYDSSFLGNAQASLYRNCGDTGAPPTLLETVASSGGAGFGYQVSLLQPFVTVDNFCQYTAYVTGLSQDSALQFRRIKALDIWYVRQVSPAPATATFNDVPTSHWAFQHIEALAESGITAGCGGGSFCPNGTVTRAEMAVFLAKALGLHWWM